MGFRSKLIMEDMGQKWKDSFREEYGSKFHIPISGGIASDHEVKFYGHDLIIAIRDGMVDIPDTGIRCVLLHECGGITVVDLFVDKILWMVPTEWEATNDTGHHYCYGCCEHPNYCDKNNKPEAQ